MVKRGIYWVLVILLGCSAGFLVSMYSYPSREFDRTWKLIAREVGTNRWMYSRRLADDTSKTIVRPNVDTMYSYAAIDLSNGPLVIQMPGSDRYWTVEFMKENTDVYAYIGSRLQGLNKDVTVILADPDFKGDAHGITVIRYPHKRSWLLARHLVDGRDDLPRVHDLQDRMLITPLKDYPF